MKIVVLTACDSCGGHTEVLLKDNSHESWLCLSCYSREAHPEEIRLTRWLFAEWLANSPPGRKEDAASSL